MPSAPSAEASAARPAARGGGRGTRSGVAPSISTFIHHRPQATRPGSAEPTCRAGRSRRWSRRRRRPAGSRPSSRSATSWPVRFVSAAPCGVRSAGAADGGADGLELDQVAAPVVPRRRDPAPRPRASALREVGLLPQPRERTPPAVVVGVGQVPTAPATSRRSSRGRIACQPTWYIDVPITCVSGSRPCAADERELGHREIRRERLAALGPQAPQPVLRRLRDPAGRDALDVGRLALLALALASRLSPDPRLKRPTPTPRVAARAPGGPRRSRAPPSRARGRARRSSRRARAAPT